MRKWFLLWAVWMCLGWGVAAQSPAIIGPETYPAGVNPLTGLAVADAAVLARRPLIVKVINAPAEVRPQSGLMAADVVWEHLLAGGITRFAAVYWSQSPDFVGPVRSLRLVDFALVKNYRALIASSGMSQGTFDYMQRDEIVPLRNISGAGPCPALCRLDDPDVPLEYTLYANTPAIRDLAAELERDAAPEPVSGMAFSEALPAGALPLRGIAVQYVGTTVLWEWETEIEHWKRSQDGAPHTDASTNAQITADNVVILEDDHIEQPFVADQYWGPPNYAFDVNLVGTGRAIMLRDGHYIIGEWRRDSQEDVLRFFDADGQVLPFKPGNTFFNLVPRWVNGYGLRFDLPTPYRATVTVFNANLRRGPSANYAIANGAVEGTVLDVIGRNNDGEWLQVAYQDDVVWVANAVVDVEGDVFAVPPVRSTAEN